MSNLALELFPTRKNLITFDLPLSFKCKRCVNNVQIKLPPDDSDCTSDLSQWFHCSNNSGLPDTVLSQAWDICKSVSFVFHHRSAAAEVAAPTTDDKKPVPKKMLDRDASAEEDDADEDAECDGDDYDSDEDFVL